jgi:sigma-E factor negative regulatory protein RseC
MVRRRPFEVPADARVKELSPGDTVVVGLYEGALLSAALRAYGVPLLAMLAAGGMAHWVLEAHELLVVLAAGIGLAAGLLWLRSAAGHDELSARYRPVIIRKDASADGHCARLS